MSHFSDQTNVYELCSHSHSTGDDISKTIMCITPKRGWSHVGYVQVCIKGRNGDDYALSSLGLDDADALLSSQYSFLRAFIRG